MIVETVPSPTRPNPFTAAGVAVPMVGSKNPGEILSFGQLDWEVEARPVHSLAVDETGVGYVEHDDFRVIVRKDTGAALGVARKGYHVVQNWQAFSILEDLVGNGFDVEAAVAWKGGARVLIQARFARDVSIGGDTLATYLLLSTSHDGSSGLRLDLTNLRLACTNMIPQIRRGAIATWTHRHSTNVLGKIEVARKVLLGADRFVDAQAETIDRLIDRIVTEAEFEAIVKREFPIHDDLSALQVRRAEEARDSVRAMYASPIDGGNFAGTGWGVVNAFSSHDLWGSRVKVEEDRPLRQIVRTMNGQTGARVERIADRLLLPA